MAGCPAAAQASEQPQAEQPVFASMEFRVGDSQSKTVSHARILVIAPSGQVLASGFTDAHGRWRASLQAPQDPRFARVKRLGMVTVLAFAKGYNEAVVWEAPVEPGAVQPVILEPVRPGQRNEPLVERGNLHRHTLMALIAAYAERQGLVRQAPVPGEGRYAPWGPENSRDSSHRGR